MIYEKIINIKLLNFSSFLKRFLIVSLSIILCLNTVCKPREVKAFAIVPVVDTIVKVCGFIAAVTGAVINVHDVASWFFDNKNMNEDEVIDYFNKNISVDGDGNYTFTDDSKLVINQMLTDYNDSVKMTYRYFFNPDNVDFSIIENNDVRDELVRVMKEYPQLHFVCWGRATEAGHGTAFWLGINNDLEYAVSLNNNLGILTRNKVFTSNWNNPIPNAKICLLDSGRGDDLYWGYMPVTNPNAAVWNVSFDDIYKLYTDDKIASSTYSADTLSELTLASSKTNKVVFGVNQCIISSDSSAINCYKSEADMKKDTGNYKVGNYIPDYTGQPNYNITTTEVNNIVNNYYNDSGGGSGSGGGSSGSDDSGGSSGILDGLGKVFGAIGKVIDKIIGFLLDIVAKIVEGFTKILDLFAGTFTKLVDLVPSGFNDFLSAMFPYIPEDWITLVTASITIFALGSIFWFFRGR